MAEQKSEVGDLGVADLEAKAGAKGAGARDAVLLAGALVVVGAVLLAGGALIAWGSGVAARWAGVPPLHVILGFLGLLAVAVIFAAGGSVASAIRERAADPANARLWKRSRQVRR